MRLVSTDDLAQQFEVSYVTMHGALQDLVQDGCLVRHQGKGTFVAVEEGQKKRPVSTDMVIVHPEWDNIVASGNGAPVLAILHGCLEGADRCAGRLGVITLPADIGQKNLKQAMDRLLQHDGAIFMGDEYSDVMEEMERRGIPSVIIGGRKLASCQIAYDRMQATRLSVEHLISKGYRRIAYLGITTECYRSTVYRYYCETLQENALPVDLKMVFGSDGFKDIDGAVSRLLAGPLPEVVFVDNYQRAEILAKAARERGMRIPEDLAIMGYGIESGDGAADRSLSFMELPIKEMGREAALVLDGVVRGQCHPPVKRVLAARLNLRGSC